MRVTEFKSVTNTAGEAIELSWNAFAERLGYFTVCADKEKVSLFCGATFAGTGRRLRSNVTEVSCLILDFDNSRVVNGVKMCVEDPIHPQTAEAFLDGLDYVVVTSHSHTDAWPRFRLVLPIATPVPGAVWEQYAIATMSQLGLDLFLGSLDPIYKNPSQAYYWPSHPPEGAHYVHRGIGEPLPVYSPATVAAHMPRSTSVGPPRANSGAAFTAQQVATFWAAAMPELDQTQPGDEMKGPCPLHGGKNNKFYVNRHTGFWRCHSKCQARDEKKAGGDMYRFQELRNNVNFKTAKQQLHEVVGGEAGATLNPTQLSAIIKDAESPEAVRELAEEISRQLPKERPVLIKQAITLFPELEDRLPQDVQAARKILQFGNRDEGAAHKEALNASIEAQLNFGQADLFGLKLDPRRYEMEPSGLYIMRMVPRDGHPVYERSQPPLADRPIWPALIGTDLSTGRTWIKLAWFGSDGTLHEEWHQATILNNREGLQNLDDAPVSLGSVIGISSFLAYAKTAWVGTFAAITSAIGWCGPAAEARFVMPGDSVYEYIGPDVKLTGTVAGWAGALPDLVAMGQAGHIALAALGLSAASPLVRKMNKRNPVLGLINLSSTGKGKVLEYALSIWGDPLTMTIPAGSTLKGTQDTGKHCPDFPLFVDEMQQLNKKDTQVVEDSFYYYGNGQKRVTSSRSQTAKGGERRYGCTFYAAEDPIAVALQQGAQNRVIELQGKPLANSMMANKVQRCANYNQGAVGLEISKLLNDDWSIHVAEVELFVQDVHSKYTNLKGDDAYAVGLIRQGLVMLSEVAGIPLPADAVAQWLITVLGGQRLESRDHAEDTLRAVLEAIFSMPWSNGGTKADMLSDNEGFIAFRRSEASTVDTPLEINPTHRKVVEILRIKGQSESIARIWAVRGWLRPQARNMKWIRGAKKEGAGAYMWRFTVEALRVLGLDANFDPLEVAQ